jgi:uncharacterized protein (TIGR03437 family)
MKSTLLRRTVLIVLAFAFPIAAFADISGTATLNSGQGFNLDTGAMTSGTGGDLLFTGSSLTFVGTAKGGSLALIGSGAATYASITQVELVALAQFSSAASIPASGLSVGTIVGVGTNGGNAAKLLVTAITGSSLTFQYTTFEAAAPTGPTITKVLNNYSYIPSGFANSGIAPSSIFTIFGNNLAAPSSGAAAGLQDSTKGIPTTWNQATVTVSAGGKNFTPGLYYALPTQIAAVMPAAVPVGSATVTVNYNGTSNAFAIQVVSNALGLDSYYGTGSGLITATNPTTGVLYNYLNSAPPGQPVVFWGSGSGANAQDSDTTYTTSPHPVNQSSTVFWIGNVQATVLYAGSSGYPGLNQYNVVIPTNALTGCAVSVVGVIGGTPSNFGSLPIGNGVCQDTTLGYNGTELSQVTQTNYSSGSLELFQSTSPATSGPGTTTTQLAIGNFQQYSGAASTSGFVSIGSCIVLETATSGVTSTGMDAGTVTITGPGGAVPLVSETSLFAGAASLAGEYATINAQGQSTLPAGFVTPGATYTFQGTGGTTSPSVGPFKAQIVFSNPLFQWTNQAAASPVTRSAGQQITWSGGSPGTYVYMSGTSSNGTISGNFTCYAPVEALSFTIPSFVLETLPASTKGTLAVGNSTVPAGFSATGLTSGFGTAFGGISFSINPAYN